MLTVHRLESKMSEPFFCWTLNILLTIVIYLSAEIGQLLGIQGPALPISVVWPATGFALAAILLFGKKAGWGIFFGNFAYNFLHLYPENPLFFAPILTAFAISFGSLVQALFAGMIIRSLSSPEYFRTVKDVFIFLVPGGVLSCMIASTIGVTALYLFRAMSWEMVSYAWFTFWLGDTLGVLILTPLIIVWTLRSFPSFKKYRWEALWMGILFIVLCSIRFLYNLPLLHLLIPLTLWVTYRFHMHGATLTVFMISLVTIIPSALGFAFVEMYDPEINLLLLTSFLEITVATCLIFAAALNEREEAWKFLSSDNLSLNREIKKQNKELKQIKESILIKERLSLLKTLDSGLMKRIGEPLERIGKIVKLCDSNLKELFTSNEDAPKEIQSLIDNIKNIDKYEKQVKKIIGIIKNQSSLVDPKKIKVRTVDIHTLLNMCLNQAIAEAEKTYPGFTFSIIKTFDRKITMIPALAEELIFSFKQFFNNAIFMMKKKTDQLKLQNFLPTLEVKTIDHPSFIEIKIKDNGLGVHKDHLSSFFTSYVTELSYEDALRLDLSIPHDIIVIVHHGKVKIDSEEGKYFQISIRLPKYA